MRDPSKMSDVKAEHLTQCLYTVDSDTYGSCVNCGTDKKGCSLRASKIASTESSSSGSGSKNIIWLRGREFRLAKVVCHERIAHWFGQKRGNKIDMDLNPRESFPCEIERDCPLVHFPVAVNGWKKF
jgi:hypothetical protein